MERCSMHLLYITELRFYIRVIFDAYERYRWKILLPIKYQYDKIDELTKSSISKINIA